MPTSRVESLLFVNKILSLSPPVANTTSLFLLLPTFFSVANTTYLFLLLPLFFSLPPSPPLPSPPLQISPSLSLYMSTKPESSSKGECSLYSGCPGPVWLWLV
jgi:hypothetical protein